MNDSTTVISARNLTKNFDGFTAVDGIDFDVQPGEIFGFLGPNGSGKTTTIRMMLGLLEPSAGTVEVLGTPLTRGTRRILPRVGYMSQHFSLYDDLTVLQNLQFYGQAYGLSKEKLSYRIRDAMEMATLIGHERTATKDLSGGWRQRLALSAAILHRPELLFLDEPTAGVDPISRRAFWDLLYDLVTEGVTVFITTHYMDEAEHCHRLAFLQRGKIIAQGTPEKIKAEQMRGQVLEIEPSDPAGAVSTLKEAKRNGEIPLTEVALYGSSVHVVAPQIRKRKRVIAVKLRQKGIQPGSMAIIEPSLEDVFIACMREP